MRIKVRISACLSPQYKIVDYLEWIIFLNDHFWPQKCSSQTLLGNQLSYYCYFAAFDQNIWKKLKMDFFTWKVWEIQLVRTILRIGRVRVLKVVETYSINLGRFEFVSWTFSSADLIRGIWGWIESEVLSKVQIVVGFVRYRLFRRQPPQISRLSELQLIAHSDSSTWSYVRWMSPQKHFLRMIFGRNFWKGSKNQKFSS